MSGRNKRKTNGILILVMLTCFLFGLVAGMLTVHFATKNQVEASKEQLKMTVTEEKKVTNVYVPKRERVLGSIARNGYNTENYGLDNGFMAYFDDEGNKISHLGIDISYHVDKIDWDELAASDVEFVMLRCGYRGYSEGGLVKDEKFEEYAAEANRVGIKLGVYFFTQSITVEEAVEEAEFVLNLIKDYRIEYPVALDTELIPEESARTNVNEISDELRSEMAIAFCERIKEEGYYPIIYASENWMRRNMNLEMLNQYDFWAAQYQEENDFLYDFAMWQYTDEGSVPGIDCHVDTDISMVDYASFVPALREAVLSQGEIIETTEQMPDAVTVENIVIQN